MPVQINISGENANQAIEEFAMLSAAFKGGAPASSADSVVHTQSPAPQQQFVSAAQAGSQQQPSVSVTPAPVAPQAYPPGVVPMQAAAPAAPPPGAVPTAGAPAYTVQQLGVAAGPIVDAGGAAELTQWMQQRGADALTKLDPAYYGDFAALLRSKGAKI